MADVQLDIDIDASKGRRALDNLKGNVGGLESSFKRLGGIVSVAVGNLAAVGVGKLIGSIKGLITEMDKTVLGLDQSIFVISRNLGDLSRDGQQTSANIIKAIGGQTRSFKEVGSLIAVMSGEASQTSENLIAVGDAAFQVKEILQDASIESLTVAKSINALTRVFDGLDVEKAKRLSFDLATLAGLDFDAQVRALETIRDFTVDEQEFRALSITFKELGIGARQLPQFISGLSKGIADLDDETLKLTLQNKPLIEQLKEIIRLDQDGSEAADKFSTSLETLRRIQAGRGIERFAEPEIARGITPTARFEATRDLGRQTIAQQQLEAQARLENSNIRGFTGLTVGINAMTIRLQEGFFELSNVMNRVKDSIDRALR